MYYIACSRETNNIILIVTVAYKLEVVLIFIY